MPQVLKGPECVQLLAKALLYILLSLSLSFSPSDRSCRSLALGQQYSTLGSQPILCSSIPGLVPKQLRFCRNYIEIMPSVAEGVKLGIQECQHQFRGRRWNCTTIKNNLAIFGPVLDKGMVEPRGDLSDHFEYHLYSKIVEYGFTNVSAILYGISVNVAHCCIVSRIIVIE